MTRLWVLALVTVAAVVACDRVQLTSPTGSTISISIDRSVLPLNGQATVRAVVIEAAGTPVHNGTVVTFDSSIGRVDPPEAKTVNGIATATFLAGSVSGTGVVHAFSGAARTGSGNTSSGGASVVIGAAAAGSLAVSATPPSVSQSGGTVTISATVFDAASNTLPGVNVNFSSTTGTLSQTSAITDSNGIARTQLTTTTTATVTATAGPATPVPVTVTVSTAPSVAIDAPATATVGIPVPITISPQGGAGNTSPRQLATVLVEFGDSTSQTLTNITGSFGLTHTYQTAGGFTITARSTDVNGNTGFSSRAIVVTRSAPTVSLNISPATPQNNQIVGFTVTAAPAAAGGPAIASIRVLINGEVVFSTNNSSGAFTKGFAAGTYVVEAVATDTAGGTGREQRILVVTQ